MNKNDIVIGDVYIKGVKSHSTIYYANNIVALLLAVGLLICAVVSLIRPFFIWNVEGIECEKYKMSVGSSSHEGKVFFLSDSTDSVMLSKKKGYEIIKKIRSNGKEYNPYAESNGVLKEKTQPYTIIMFEKQPKNDTTSHYYVFDDNDYGDILSEFCSLLGEVNNE